MKNINLSNKLYEIRKESNLSQSEFASALGLTNKAISKWENGQALPSLEQIIKISNLFNVSIDSLLKEVPNKDRKVYKIAITGGPCSGKTTALSYIQENLERKGFKVFVVNESASELILSGVSPTTIDSITTFESYIIKWQLDKEKVFEEAASHVRGFNKVVLLCDRGVIDCKAYIASLQFKQCLNMLHLNEISIRDSYDAVFHLVTAALGAEKFYTLENNKARYESPEEAIKTDRATLKAWTGHPHLRVIDNSTDFECKLRRLKTEVLNVLGEDGNYEIERKFLIEYPNIKQLEKMDHCQKVDIIQTYLKAPEGFEIRIRQRGQNGNYSYYKATKRRVSNLKRIETEKRISKDEYLNLMLSADTTKRQIVKTRYCLVYSNQYFEIDVYPFWKKFAIMEIELRDEDQKITFPKNINIIKEVTEDPAFTNYAIASNKNLKI